MQKLCCKKYLKNKNLTAGAFALRLAPSHLKKSSAPDLLENGLKEWISVFEVWVLGALVFMRQLILF